MAIFFLYIRVNQNCNARCFMCDYWKNPKMEITHEQFNHSITNNPHIKMIRLTGGEPLLHHGIFDFIKTAHEKGIRTSIITNGYYLSDCLSELVNCGLDQIVISIDSCSSVLHDSLRGIPGLFSRINCAIDRINNEYPLLRTRVNTVVSEKNIHDLANLADWIDSKNIDQWSIIPIKRNCIKQLTHLETKKYADHYKIFQERAITSKTQLLGYSNSWTDEVESFLNGKERIHPKGKCNLTKMVAFYDPFTEHYFPCNCVPHRSVHFDNYEEEVSWYYNFGHEFCAGCEPINAWCSDHPEELIVDPFYF